MKTAEISLKEIEELLKLDNSGDERTFARLSNYEDAGLDSIVFAANEEALKNAKASGAGLILSPLDTPTSSDSRLLRVKDPKHAFAVCGRWLDGFASVVIHPAAVI